MAYVTIDVELDEFDTSEIVEHLEALGYTVSRDKTKRHETHTDVLEDAAWRLQRGDVEDALHLIARELGPRFRDLPEAVFKRLDA